MKMLTELSGTVIRVAAAAIAEARRSPPSDEKPATPAMAEAPAQGAGAATGEAPAQSAASAETPSATAAPPAPHREAESGATKETIDAAVAKATGLSGDRLAMLHGAVEAVGRRTVDVRLVRVFGLEEQVTGATQVGAYQYVVDLFPASMTQVAAPGGDRGRRRGARGGGRGGGDRGVKGSGVGGFSMDSLREDRKNERGGRGAPGGGRRSRGGGGGGGSGGPPGGAPKT